MTTPPISPRTFPYRRKWTQTQVDEIMDRHKRLLDAMTDAVGPIGQVLNVPPDALNIFALHLSLAGGDVDDDRAYITAIIRNQQGVPADFHQWVLKSEYEPAPPEPDQVKAKAEAALEQIQRQLTPEVRRAVTNMMIKKYNEAVSDDDTGD